ncbi:MAG: DUF748 domain-containing protein [Paenacidovorax caeni]
MVQQWMATHRAPAPAVEPGATPATARVVQLGTIDLDGGSLALRCTACAARGVQCVGAAHTSGKLGSAGAARRQTCAVAACRALARGASGRLEYDGTLGLAPVSAQGQVLATQFPLHAFEPYVADALNVRVVRADGSFKGSVHYAEQPQGGGGPGAG